MEIARDTSGSLELARTVRFCIDRHNDSSRRLPQHNTFAGWPTMTGLGAFYELEIVCRGNADPLTGYMLNISTIDQAARSNALPIIERAIWGAERVSAHFVLAEVFAALRGALNGIVWSVRWALTPYYSITMNAASVNEVLISQMFEFSAAHRLKVDSWTPEHNRAVFGKCHNENGHGHNYRLDVQAFVPLQSEPSQSLSLAELERIVNATIVQRFDHKHLNLDTNEFAALNPSVENIAKVCHDLLREPLLENGFRLKCVSIWETEKTRCTYPASE